VVFAVGSVVHLIGLAAWLITSGRKNGAA